MCHYFSFFMYFFLPDFSFSIVKHFDPPTISSIILFFTFDINFSFPSFFHFDFSNLLLCLFNLQRFDYLVYFLLESVAVILLFSFFYRLLDFSFFIANFYIMIQHQCCILYSLFCRLYSCFHQYPCVCFTDW